MTAQPPIRFIRLKSVVNSRHGAAVAFLAALELWLAYEATHPEPPPTPAQEQR
jgi:hypothetical protein